ncbi:MAG: AEC family transporter [Trueperaceae bacterium]|nr:AEC family transporter [Trueperaceae bacterium]
MPLVASALVPIVLLIALGLALRRSRFLPEPFWPGLDRLNYWVFFPSLIFVSLAGADSGLVGTGPVGLAVWGGLAATAGAALLLGRIATADGPAFTSVFQGSIRFNSYVAFIVVPTLFPGSEALTALLVALTVPVVNVASVVVLARHASSAPLRWRTLLTSVASNPLILASLLGVGASRLAVPLGPFEAALTTLGQASLASGLLSVGAILRFGEIRASVRPIAVSTALKAVILPATTFAFATALGLPTSTTGPLIVFQALPTAPASYVLAKAMGGDGDLMAAILAVHTVAAMAWLPLAFALLGPLA